MFPQQDKFMFLLSPTYKSEGVENVDPFMKISWGYALGPLDHSPISYQAPDKWRWWWLWLFLWWWWFSWGVEQRPGWREHVVTHPETFTAGRPEPSKVHPPRHIGGRSSVPCHARAPPPGPGTKPAMCRQFTQQSNVAMEEIAYLNLSIIVDMFLYKLGHLVSILTYLIHMLLICFSLKATFRQGFPSCHGLDRMKRNPSHWRCFFNHAISIGISQDQYLIQLFTMAHLSQWGWM